MLDPEHHGFLGPAFGLSSQAWTHGTLLFGSSTGGSGPGFEVTSIRAALDADGLPYSILVYAIFAALQTLHAARLTGLPAGSRDS